MGKSKQLFTWAWKLATERKEFRYIESGVAGEIIEYGLFLLLFWPTGWLYFSSSASYIISAVCSFLFHKYWSFKGDQKYRARSQAVTFAVMAGINFFISNALVGLFVYKVSVRPAYSKLLAIGLTAVISFSLSNFVIFRHKKPEA
jgi:putative flippase GtrA